MDTAFFFSAIFTPGDWILIRPVETWTEAGRKRSCVDYDGIRYERLGLRDAAGRWMPHPEAIETAITEARARAAAEQTNLFYGVCPRLGPGAAFDKAWQIRTVRCLWADVDDCGPTEAAQRIQAAGLPKPSALVSSGNGAHLYWMLADPYLIPDDLPPPVYSEWTDTPAGRRPREYLIDEDGDRLYLDARQNVPPLPQAAVDLQDILAGLAAKIGGDHVQDMARLLRIPETWNRKDERNGRAPVKCELLDLDPGRRYPIDDFLPLAKNSPSSKRRHQVAQVRLPATTGKIGKRQQSRLHDLANACAVADVGQRSEADFAICCYAVEHGLPREQVWGEISGLGKFAEAGERYFDMTWQAAEGHTREQIYEKARGKADARKQSKQQDQQPTGETAALEADDDPHRLARVYLDQQARHPDHGYTLRWWREEWWQWTGTSYRRIGDSDMRSRVNGTVKQEFDRLNVEAQDSPQGDGVPKAYKVTQALVTNVLGAMGALTVTDAALEQMGWMA